MYAAPLGRNVARKGAAIDERVWKIGELAEATGLTVRTLRHYDRIGLLTPTKRTEAGYRLYGKADVARLQRILSLRHLGFPLERIKALLDGGAHEPQRIVSLQLDRVARSIALQQRLRDQLEALAAALAARRDVSAEEFLQLIEVMHMVEKHGFDPGFTPEEMDKIKGQGQRLGQETIREVEREWPELIEKVKAEMDRGTPPDDPRVQTLARRWRELVGMFSGGDAGIERKLEGAYEQAPEFGAQFGMDPALFEYVGKAMAALE